MNTQVSSSTLERHEQRNQTSEITLYSHSVLVYWWPVWIIGYILALMTHLGGHAVQLGDFPVVMHPSKNLGVVFTMTVFLVVILTNFTVRGVASVALIAAIVAITFGFAYMNWWDDIFEAIGNLAIFMNLGFYVFFSTAIFIAWFLSVFVYDRVESWTFRPGQMEHHRFGGGSQVYDANGMTIDKLQDDFFRHKILGMGTGDMHIKATGATSYDEVIRNVFWVNRKINGIQALVAMKPDESRGTVTVGDVM